MFGWPFHRRSQDGRFRARRFVILGIHHSWHAVAVARHLAAAGLRPELALVSAAHDGQLDASRPFWQRPRWWRRAREVLRAHAPLAERDEPDAVPRVYQETGVPYLFVPGFGSDLTCGLLEAAGADAIVLAEGPILKGRILRTAPGGIINLHAAPLPAYRGNCATWWALYHDEPLEACAHLVTEGVDTGPLLARRRLPVRRGDTLEDIDRRGFEVCGELLVEVLQHARGGGIVPRPQRDWEGRTFRGWMPQDIVDECRRRLRELEYTHYE